MRPTGRVFAILATFLASLVFLASPMISNEASAQEEGRFDAQVFRPSAAPRDLVMVQKSEVIGHKSPTVGFFSDIGFDPLVLVSQDTGQTVEAVAARLQLTGLIGFGLFDWADLTLAVPFVAYQGGDNLRSLGTEGPVQTQSVGDTRLSARVAIPGLNRRGDKLRGLGMAVVGNLNLPTGNPLAFSGDGILTGGVTLITDYRFKRGVITTNAGIWLRPERQVAGVRVGDMGSFGVAGESYVVQSWGISVLGGVYGYPSLNKFPDSARQIPAEVILALRWQTKHGITWTFGGSFGAACAFGSPALRLFNGLTWQPSFSREQERINKILEDETNDPDGDGLTGDVDKCPDEPGPAINNGCPEIDSDGDGLVDSDDGCPQTPQGPTGQDGCPPARIDGDRIVILGKVHFATDKDIILDKSKPALEAVAAVLEANPDILSLRIEGHTDIRHSHAYNMALSQRRASSVRTFLIEQGVDAGRLEAVGYGHTQPIYDDTGCAGPDELLSDDCKQMTSTNRRVIFRILERVGVGAGAPDTKLEPSRIFFPVEILFEADEEEFAAEDSAELLDRVVRILQDNQDVRKVVIEGHTDGRHSPVFAKALSERRAVKVRDVLIQRGIDPKRLETKAVGTAAPLEDDTECLHPDKLSTEECQTRMAKNRRVIFRIVERIAVPSATPPTPGPAAQDPEAE